MERTLSNKEKAHMDTEMHLSLQPSCRIGGVDNVTHQEDKATKRKLDLVLMPLLGFCYMLQFLDKATISYSAVLGLPQDTVMPHNSLINNVHKRLTALRNSTETSSPGPPRYSTLATSSGPFQHPTSWSDSRSENTYLLPSAAQQETEPALSLCAH